MEALESTEPGEWSSFWTCLDFRKVTALILEVRLQDTLALLSFSPSSSEAVSSWVWAPCSLQTAPLQGKDRSGSPAEDATGHGYHGTAWPSCIVFSPVTQGFILVSWSNTSVCFSVGLYFCRHSPDLWGAESRTNLPTPGLGHFLPCHTPFGKGIPPLNFGEPKSRSVSLIKRLLEHHAAIKIDLYWPGNMLIVEWKKAGYVMCVI